jgi:hypothetical protein
MGGLCLLALAAPGVADAPPGRYDLSVSGTVRDTRTSLTWQRVVSVDLRPKSSAAAYCTSLSLAGSGWRLPQVSELLTLVDRTRNQPAIDGTAFPDTPVTWFWSSTPYAPDPTKGWRVDFGIGYSNSFELTTVARVRCVR